MTYNWQQKDWPQFKYELKDLEEVLFAIAEETGHISGILKAMSEVNQSEAIINMMVSEAIKTSEIEGEYISRRDVVSSIRNNLGLNISPEKIKDKRAKGVGELMVAVRNNYADPLTRETLFLWHKMLFGQSSQMNTGVWRTHKDPMQVISGAMGKEKIHFEAPPSAQVSQEMKRFIIWFNDTAPGGRNEIKKAPVRSAIAHLYFESIHPFEDGNGRIGRAIAEKALSQTIGRPVLLSLSQTIETNKKAYYGSLEKAQKTNEITAWITYFVKLILAAQRQAQKQIEFTLSKAKYFDRFKDMLNDRQLKVINKMFGEGPKGFEGGITAAKYVSITKTSKATATRDLQGLCNLGGLTIIGGGRSTRYNLPL